MFSIFFFYVFIGNIRICALVIVSRYEIRVDILEWRMFGVFFKDFDWFFCLGVSFFGVFWGDVLFY